jgi:ribosomal protein S18 acetylase RimI-like enzyme
VTPSLAFRTDLALLAVQGAELSTQADGTVVRMPENPAFRWGNFLLVQRAGDPAARIAQHREAFPDARFTTIGVDDAHPELDEGAWLSAGFDVERLAVLVAERAPVAAGTGVRPFRSDEDWSAETAIAMEEDEEAGAEHVRFSRLRTLEKRRMADAGHAVWLGVEQDGVLVATAGVADAGDRTARFQDVQTRAAHRRRGYATALIAAGVRTAAERFGSRRFVLVAERQGPAIGLYRRLGFREVETQLQLSRIDAPVGMGA